MEQNFINGGFGMNDLKMPDINVILSRAVFVLNGKKYVIDNNITSLNNLIKLLSQGPNKIEIPLIEQPQTGGFDDINTLNSIFYGNSIQQGGNKNVFSSTSNMFNGFQNGGLINTSTTSLNNELDLSIFTQLETKTNKQNGGELSTLASIFDV